jgi:hypothetical protein
LIIGEAYNMLEPTKLLLHNMGISSTIKELTYLAFINNYQDYFGKYDKVYEAVQIVREYCK